jgi:hypothetical protein
VDGYFTKQKYIDEVVGLQFNERLLDLFIEKLALDPTWIKTTLL